MDDKNLNGFEISALSFFSNIRSLSADALLQLVENGILEAIEWPKEAFEILNSRDLVFNRKEFEKSLEPWPRVKIFAVAFDEICCRKDVLQPNEREHFLNLINPRPENLKRAKPFFQRLSPEIDELKSKHSVFKSHFNHHRRLNEAGFSKVTVTVPNSQIDYLKKIATEITMENSNLPPPLPRGRPRFS